MLRKIKNAFMFFWNMEFIRFAFAGGINTLVGFLVKLAFGENMILGVFPWASDIFLLEMTWGGLISVILEFLLCFPLSYTLQAKIAFRQKWELKRMFLYITTIFPNMLLQFLMEAILPSGGVIPSPWRDLLIVILPLPIMFFIIKFIVTPMKKKKGEKEESKENF